MRNRRERGVGLVFGLFFFLFVSALATGIVARSAMHARALHWSEKKIEALAIAEAGMELIAHSDQSHLEQPFARGRFAASAQPQGERITIVSRGMVMSATGAAIAVTVRAQGRRVGAGFWRDQWEIIR